MKKICWLGLLVIILSVVGCVLSKGKASKSQPMTKAELCPALSPPQGPIVIACSEAELRAQVYDAAAGTTILVAPGTYHMQDLVQIVNAGIGLRGQSGSRGDVILDFGGMSGGHFGILVEADDVTIADLTIRNANDHGVSIQGSDRPILYNLHIQDIGDQLVKVNPDGDGSEDGLLACSRLEYTSAAPNEYTNGISAHNAHRWTVRDNQWYRIRTPGNAPVPTILFWSGSSDTLVERNLLVDCYQGIAFGNASHGSGDHLGGIVRNNMIYASMPHDVAIEMVHAKGWLVAHNSALLLNPDGPDWGLEARYADSTGVFAYNLTNMAIINRDDAQAELSGNVINAGSDWFVDAANGDLHLSASANAAIDQAAPLAQVTDDYDGDARPNGTASDVGADVETGGPPVSTPTPTETSSPPSPTPQATAAPPPFGDLIQPADLVYQGAFRLPDWPDPEIGWPWSGAALAFYPHGDPGGAADGYPGSLFGTGHDWNQYVSEVSIPLPLVSPAKNLSDLNTATTLQGFQDIRGGLFAPMEILRVGLAYLQGAQSSGKLYFAWAQHLDEGNTGPSHGWCELDLANPQTAGVWQVGDYWNYVTGDYLFEIPRSWADMYAPGMYLATGRFRDGGQGAQGPSIFAIAPWNHGNPPPGGSQLAATPLLLYADVTMSEERVMDDYHHSDEWSGAVWLTAGSKAAVLFVGSKGQGDCWYGCADGRVWQPPYPPECPERGWWSSSFVGQMLFYDPADLAAVAQGGMQTWQPQPYATLNVDSYLYGVMSEQQKHHLGAASFDRERGLLYVFEPLVDDDKPILHVWKIE